MKHLGGALQIQIDDNRAEPTASQQGQRLVGTGADLTIDFEFVERRTEHTQGGLVAAEKERLRNSVRMRVTVSREVPISCAISSWVSASFRRTPSFVFSPLSAHSNSSRAIFSDTECESPNVRINS